MKFEHRKLTAIQWRRNYVTATVIEIGIGMQEMHGTQIAAQYMRVMGVRLDMAVRVLGSSKHRTCWTLSLPPMQWRESTITSALIVYQDISYGQEISAPKKVAVKTNQVRWQKIKHANTPSS
jgi:hypothetical protein